MVDARRKAFEREHNGRAWLAFHIAHLPNQKRPIPLSDLLITREPKGAQAGIMSGAEIETVMRRWRFVMARPPAPKIQRPRIQTR